MRVIGGDFLCVADKGQEGFVLQVWQSVKAATVSFWQQGYQVPHIVERFFGRHKKIPRSGGIKG
jgi:hypothetical protein